MLATRGCPYECTFCSNPEMWTTRWIARIPGKVLDEIQLYQERYGATNFDFYDLTAIVKRSWIIEFTQMILDRKMVFTWQLPSGTRSEAIDDEVSRLLYRVGMPEHELRAGERLAGRAQAHQEGREARSAGSLGSRRGPQQAECEAEHHHGVSRTSRAASSRETVRFLLRMGLAGVHDMSISIFSPYPGSELYHDLRKSGKIPELSDEYFLGLGAYKDFSAARLVHRRAQSQDAQRLPYPRLPRVLRYASTSCVRGGWRGCSRTCCSTGRNRGSTNRCRISPIASETGEPDSTAERAGATA